MAAFPESDLRASSMLRALIEVRCLEDMRKGLVHISGGKSGLLSCYASG